LIAVEILIALEKILCPPNGERKGLADYFDFIGGTSTGSIISTGLALGMRAEKIKDFYKQYGFKIFQKRNIFAQLWSRYDGKPLEEALKVVFGQETLGSSQLKTRLMIVAKNATEGNTWFFTNDKKNRYNRYYETNSKRLFCT
jgi:patatin-like phospholipase/acyl hydrolase